MSVLRGSATHIQDALEGGPVDPRVREDVDTLQALAGLRLHVEADPDFVAALRERLAHEALPTAAPTRRSSAGSPSGPRTLRWRAAPRLLLTAGVAAVAVLVLGLAARTALPGQPLYAVRGVLEGAAVAASRGDQSRGLTLLSQAERHVADATALVDDPAPAAPAIVTAVERSGRAVQDGNSALAADFERSRDPAGLSAVGAFADRVLPQVETLSSRVPADALPAVTGLRSLVTEVRQSALQTLAACTTCGPAAESARQRLGTPPSPDATQPPAPPTPTTAPTDTTSAPTGQTPLPTAPPTAPGTPRPTGEPTAATPAPAPTSAPPTATPTTTAGTSPSSPATTSPGSGPTSAPTSTATTATGGTTVTGSATAADAGGPAGAPATATATATATVSAAASGPPLWSRASAARADDGTPGIHRGPPAQDDARPRGPVKTPSP